MPIEFHCGACDQLLRVPDTAAGKQAKCPKCGEIVSVPSASTPNSNDDPFGAPTPPNQPSYNENPFADSPETQNPFASPTTESSHSYSPTNPSAPEHRIIDVGEVMSAAWDIFKANMGTLVIATLIIFGVSIAFSVVQQIFMAVAGQAAGDNEAAAITIVAVSGLGSILSGVVQAFLGIGLIRMFLAAARGQTPEIGMLFSGGDVFIPYLLASILYGIIVGIGFLLLIIPGIILVCGLWPYPYFVVDRKEGITESLSSAWKYTKGNRLTSILLFLIAMGLAILGVLMCGVGLLFTQTLAGCVFTVAYLMMTGQPIARYSN
ncbi:MAG: hypothetical protein R3C28_09700 [Pirellulaceae bacterium]